jgi:hypothetical protein
MRTLLLALLVVGCAANDPQQSTFPQQPQSMEQSGPPGGQMDPQYAYQGPPQGYAGPQYGAPQQPQPQYSVNSQAQPPQYDEQQGDVAQGPGPDQGDEPSADPQDPNYVMGDVGDQEIDQTLAPYGQWEDDDGTQVWVPNTTTVGMDFMPYSSCGSWMWSDVGWNFNCDYAWGWLPFHYGRWGWFNNHWGWTRGYKWGPGWVDWRSGGGVVGWRPMAPGVGHFAMHDSHWSFVHENQLGAGHIAGHLTVGAAEGLHTTHSVAQLSTRGNYTPVASASLMRGRLQTQHDIHVNSANNVRSTSANGGSRAQQPTWQRSGGTQSVRSYNGGGSYNTSRSSGSYRSTPSYHSTGPARVYRGSSSSSSHSSSSSSHSSGGHSSGGGGHHR